MPIILCAGENKRRQLICVCHAIHGLGSNGSICNQTHELTCFQIQTDVVTEMFFCLDLFCVHEFRDVNFEASASMSMPCPVALASLLSQFDHTCLLRSGLQSMAWVIAIWLG